MDFLCPTFSANGLRTCKLGTTVTAATDVCSRPAIVDSIAALQMLWLGKIGDMPRAYAPRLDEADEGSAGAMSHSGGHQPMCRGVEDDSLLAN